MNLWVILWLLSIFIGMRKASQDKIGNVTYGLAYKNMISVRGILALEIVLGHFYGRVLNPGLIIINNRIGVLVVGMFLFLSGWGLCESRVQKKNYFKGFLRRHFVRIVLPIYILYFIQICIFRTDGYKIFVRGIIKEILGSQIIYYTNWFIWELLALYFLFFLFYRCKKEIVSNCILALGMVLFIGIGSYLQIGSRWYGSILCFLMGIVYSQKQEKLNEWMKQKFWKKLVFGSLLFLLSLFLFIKLEDTIWANTILICVSTLLFCSLAVMLLTVFRIGNSMTYFLGEISYEIFIAHAGIMEFWKQRIEGSNDLVYSLVSIITIIVVSWSVHGMLQWGQKKVNKRI
ncbi:MAG: acyltransferase family protein [Lachnospiraceae bacterium]|nr:acyltransferase family protein [Lachnospiraceae bacterium]